jgi:hypothetical protein
MMLCRSAANRQTLKTAFKTVVLLSLFSFVTPYSKSLSDNIEAWESKALQATDPDIDVTGLPQTSLRQKRAISNSAKNSVGHSLESIESWETKALRDTDPDMDALDRIPSDRSQQRFEKQVLDGNVDGMKQFSSDSSLNVSPDSRSAASDSIPHPQKAQLLDVSHSRAQKPGKGAVSHPQAQQLGSTQSADAGEISAQAPSAAPAQTPAAPPALANLPAQIKEVRNFLLGLQTQVHQDAKESARSLADLRRVYHSQDQNSDADAYMEDPSSVSTRRGAPLPPAVARALASHPCRPFARHRAHPHARRPSAGGGDAALGGRSARPDGRSARPDDDTRSALDAAEAADAQARRLVARSAGAERKRMVGPARAAAARFR